MNELVKTLYCINLTKLYDLFKPTANELALSQLLNKKYSIERVTDFTIDMSKGKK